MKQVLVLALLVAGVIAATPPGNAPTAAPAAPSNPAMLARAQAAFGQLQAGSLDRSALDAPMNAALTDDKLTAVKSAIGSLGAPASFVEVKTGSQGGYPYGVYLVTFANGTKVDFIFSVDGQGKIAGMQLTPPQ